VRFSGTCKKNADAQCRLPTNFAVKYVFCWPQICRVKITFGLLPPNWFVFTKKNSMKCFVKWIPLRICVRSRNTQPYLKFSKASSSRCSELALENFHVNKDAATFLCRSKFSKVRCVVILCSQVRSKLALENLHFNKVAATCLSRRKILEIQQYNHFMLSI